MEITRYQLERLMRCLLLVVELLAKTLDVHAADDNGIDSIAVLHGYGTREELDAAGPTHIVDSLVHVGPVVLRA